MSLVLVEHLGQVTILTLNRVDKLNAFSHQLMLDLRAALSEVEARCDNFKTRVVILKSGTPRAFCVGADLAERSAMTDAQVSETLATQRELVDKVAALAAPTLALLEGVAFGLGLELALACDLRIAHPKSQMGLPETRLAIIPGAGGTQRLARTVGVAKAKEMIFRGLKISADEALKIGLVNAVAEGPGALAQEWAAEMLMAGPIALGASKKAIDGGWDLDLPEGLDWERACYETVLKSKDRKEALLAFSEKRAPKFSGS